VHIFTYVRAYSTGYIFIDKFIDITHTQQRRLFLRLWGLGFRYIEGFRYVDMKRETRSPALSCLIDLIKVAVR